MTLPERRVWGTVVEVSEDPKKIVSSFLIDPKSVTVRKNRREDNASAGRDNGGGPEITYNPKWLKSQDDNKKALIVGHELTHLINHDGESNAKMLQEIGKTPLGLSGSLFIPYNQKKIEQKADFGGQDFYLQSGRDPSYFQNNPMFDSPLEENDGLLNPLTDHYSDEQRAGDLLARYSKLKANGQF